MFMLNSLRKTQSADEARSLKGHKQYKKGKQQNTIDVKARTNFTGAIPTNHSTKSALLLYRNVSKQETKRNKQIMAVYSTARRLW